MLTIDLSSYDRLHKIAFFFVFHFKMASEADLWYLSLLGLAEHFRVSTPPNIRLCVQCLQTVFNFKPPARVEARTHLQLGNILVQYTKNVDLARSHLEQAVISSCTASGRRRPVIDLNTHLFTFQWFISQSITGFDDIKFESASLLAELYEQQNQTNLAKPMLRKAIEMSQQNVYWHCRLLFQLAVRTLLNFNAQSQQS